MFVFSKRPRRGFALIAVLSISLVMMLLSTALLVKATAMRRDGSSQRGSIETFYAADAGINTLVGQLNQLQLGTNTITASLLSANLQAVTSSNLSTSIVTTDAASSRLVAGSSYTTSGNVATNAIPQELGLGSGFLIYSFIARDASGNPLASCSQFNASCSIPANVGSIDVAAIGFKGRGAASIVSASIIPGAPGSENWFIKNKNAVFSDNDVTMNTNSGGTYSGMPFYYKGVVVYIRAICRAGATITPRTSLCNTGETLVTSVTADVTDTLARLGYVPDYPDGMTSTLQSTYNYLPQGNQGNVANNGNSGGGIGINGAINGSVTNYGCPSSGCINGNGTITGDATTYGCTVGGKACTQNTTVSGTSTGITSQQKLSLPAPPPAPDSSKINATAVNGTQTLNKGASGSCSNSNGQQIIKLDMSFIYMQDSDKLTLCSGKYVINQSLATGGQEIIISQNANKDPVQIYLLNNVNLNLNGKITNVSGSASALQIYGTAMGGFNISLGTGDFTGLIYAPYSNINVNATSNLYGAVVGLHVNFGNSRSYVVFDESLGSATLPVTTSAAGATSATVRNWRRL